MRHALLLQAILSLFETIFTDCLVVTLFLFQVILEDFPIRLFN